MPAPGDGDPPVGGGVGHDADEPAGPLTLRWREARAARGGLRLAQRVRANVVIATLPEILNNVADAAFADEFCVEWSDGSRAYLSREVLEAWAARRRSDLPELHGSLWEDDLRGSNAKALAIDGMRIAVARLLATGVIAEAAADDLVQRVHVAAQSLTVSSLGAWRS